MKFTLINNLIKISSKLNCHLTLIADGTMKIVLYETKHLYKNVCRSVMISLLVYQHCVSNTNIDPLVIVREI